LAVVPQRVGGIIAKPDFRVSSAGLCTPANYVKLGRWTKYLSPESAMIPPLICTGTIILSNPLKGFGILVDSLQIIFPIFEPHPHFSESKYEREFARNLTSIARLFFGF
jgi:hypothetical protein